MRLRFLMSVVLATAAVPFAAAAQSGTDFRVLATSKTSTMEKEMGDAAAAGYRFAAVMGGETSFGGSEVVVLMQKTPRPAVRYEYRLLTTSKTSTMQRELQAAADEGFEYVGQTVFQSTFGGSEVGVILERNPTDAIRRFEYRLVATSKTSTLQKELQAAGDQGFEALGMTVGKTALGGNELVVIARKKK
jgi:hypothetical protein